MNILIPLLIFVHGTLALEDALKLRKPAWPLPLEAPHLKPREVSCYVWVWQVPSNDFHDAKLVTCKRLAHKVKVMEFGAVGASALSFGASIFLTSTEISCALAGGKTSKTN